MSFQDWISKNRITYLTYPGSLYIWNVGYQVLTSLQNVNLTKLLITNNADKYFILGGNTNFPLIEFGSYNNIEKVLPLQTGILIFDDSVELAKTMTNVSAGTTWHTILNLSNFYVIILNTWGVDKLMYTELSRFTGGYLKLKLKEEEYEINLEHIVFQFELSLEQSKLFVSRKEIELKDKSHKGKTQIKTTQMESFMYPDLIQRKLDISSQDKSIPPDSDIMTIEMLNTLNLYSPGMLALFKNILNDPTKKHIVRSSLLNRYGIYLICKGLELLNIKYVSVEGKTSDTNRNKIIDNFRKDSTIIVYVTTVDIPDYMYDIYYIHLFNGISTYSYSNLHKYVLKINNYSTPKPHVKIIFYIGVLHPSVEKGLKAEIKNTPSLLLYRAIKNTNNSMNKAFENYLTNSTFVELH